MSLLKLMSRQPPLVSVVVPVHNGGRYLAAALDSVLSQQAGPLQVVVVDDGSIDDTAEVARRYAPAVEYRRQPHSGPNLARNAGVSRAEGRFVAFIDADDVWVAGKLESQLAACADAAGPEVAFGHVEEFVSPDVAGSIDAPVRVRPAGAVPGYISSTMFARRTALLEVGPFDERLRAGELIEWIWRARLRGVRVAMLSGIVARRRLHAGNLGRREPEARIDYVRAVKAALDRRRGRLSEVEPT